MLLFLPLGLFLAAVMPLGQVPDEPAHAVRAESLLHGEWIGERRLEPDADGKPIPREGVLADPGVLDALSSYPRPNDLRPIHVSGRDLARGEAARFHARPRFLELGAIAAYCPVFYVPAALAIGLTRLLHGTPHTAFLLARLCNLVLCFGIGFAALRLARRGRELMLIALVLPPSVSLAASLSQDGLIIAAATLAAACASRLDADSIPVRSPSFRIAFLLVAAIVIAKPPYLPLVVLLFLPLGRRRRSSHMGQRLLASASILVSAAIWTVLTVRYAAVPIHRAPEAAGPLWPDPHPPIFDHTDMGAQLHVLLARPWRFVTLPVHTLVIHPEIFAQMLGVLGWLNLLLSPALTVAWALALLSATLAEIAASGSATRPIGSAAGEGALLLAASAATVLLIYVSQYLSFTPVGYDWVSGPQGRYLIPLVPVLALALPAVPILDRIGLFRWLTLVPAAAGLLGLYLVPRAVVAFYYAGP